jgi:hypothetical protein
VTVSTPDNDWQRIWFATRERDWNSLAIIPSDAGIDVVEVANMLVATGRQHGERPVSLLDATDVHLGDVHNLVDSLVAQTGRGNWVIVPVDPIAENPNSLPIIRATSAALLVVRLDESYMTSARATLEIIGHDRFLGSVVLEKLGGRPGASLDTSRP